MTFVPSFKLYQSDGLTLITTISNVITTNWPEDNPSSVQLVNLRSANGIIIPGGNKPWELRIRGVLVSTNYENLQSAIETFKSNIQANTHYVLKIDKSPTTTDNLNVMRLTPIILEEGRRTKFQYYNLTFLVNSWS